VHAAGFSPDGSLVVLAHGQVVTLWDATTNVFVRALESPVDARKLAFAGPEGRYIVAAARTGVAVWDVLSCELVATLPNQAADMLVGLRSGILAARAVPPKKGTQAQPKTEVTIMGPNGSAGRTVTLATPISALASLPSTAVHLVGIAPSGEIYRFGELQKASAPTKRAIQADAPRRATSIWQEMFGRDAFLDELAPPPEKEEAAVSALQRAAAGRPEAVFEGASHTLPPVGMLFDAFMDELLAPRPEGEDAPMEVDEEEAATLEASVAPDAVRAVTDREVAELETFFRGLRTSAKPKPKPLPKKKPNGLPNGNGHRAVSTPVKKKSKSVPTTPGTPGTPSTPDAEMVDGKRSKKRKAPRHSEL
jgi:NET1-associated nuclear protein 1 (U3 small nucleolar RNA-associated protein 17)